MKMKISEEQVKDILEMHSKMKTKVITEQAQNVVAPATPAAAQPSQVTTSVEDQLKELLTNGCVPFGDIVKMKSTNPQLQFAIKQKSTTSNNVRYLFIDKRYALSDGTTMKIATDKWACSTKKVEPKVEPKVDPNKPKQLNQSQLDLLARLKQYGSWFTEPAPSDFQVAQGEFQKDDLTSPDSIAGADYKSSEYFTKKDFPNGFFIYQKVVKNPNPVKNTERVEVTEESCKVAINGLWNNMKSPRSYPLDGNQKRQFKETALICAEQANKKMLMFDFRLKKRLNDLNL